MSLTIVRAEPSQATGLTELAYAAKAHWGYPEGWLKLWREQGALDVSESFITQHPTFAAFDDDKCVGFYSLMLQEDLTLQKDIALQKDLALQRNSAVLEHLFVKPSFIGKGVGKFLFQHALAQAKQLDVNKLRLEADPNAKDFYEHMGMKQIGEAKSTVFGAERVLPIMELEL